VVLNKEIYGRMLFTLGKGLGIAPDINVVFLGFVGLNLGSAIIFFAHDGIIVSVVGFTCDTLFTGGEKRKCPDNCKNQQIG
jgi:hypothetical protein